MPSTVATSPTPSTSGEPIPIRFKLIRRFYEPVVLEIALKNSRPQGFASPRNAVDMTSDSIGDAEQAFKCFVNRLAQVCDERRAGSTVTAIAVLEEADCVHYIIGSNKRKHADLQKVQQHVSKLLEIIGRSEVLDAQTSSITRNALWHVLRFNKDRVGDSLKYAAQYLDSCIEDYERKHPDDPNGNTFKKLLLTLREKLKFRENPDLTDDLFFTYCEKLLMWINQSVRDSKFADSISEQAKDGEFNQSLKWMELRHYVGRLLSYHLAVETIVRTGKRWSRLFHEVKVTVIPSASLAPNPLNKRKTNAHDIIGRMMSTDQAAVYRAHAQELQQYGLDEAIQDECEISSKHFVHCEILVLDYVLKYMKGKDAIGFWNNWRYIGASKPSCRLCSYYFAAHPSGVKTRESHGNIYASWRVPDVFNATEEKQRDWLLNTIVQRIREDVKRTIEERKPQGRKHDSNSFSEMPRHFVTGETEHGSISDIISRIGALGISSRRSTVQSIAEEEDTQSVGGNADGSDDEGGVSLR